LEYNSNLPFKIGGEVVIGWLWNEDAIVRWWTLEDVYRDKQMMGEALLMCKIVVFGLL
jgi:hypothetical protein